ncbi:MAG TPA: hypothetical protein PLO89_07765 [Spirochaetota bacterium]|nr:hypothetical protein [Spirochaetota bacterium]
MISKLDIKVKTDRRENFGDIYKDEIKGVNNIKKMGQMGLEPTHQ